MAHKKYIKFLEDKFGKVIVESITEPNNFLQLKKGHSKDLYVKNLSEHNRNKVMELVPNFPEVIEKEEWAFDFPGWVGELDFSADSVKEIMVIGLEPHIGISDNPNIGNRNFQATYGLRETADNEFGEIDEYKPNTRLWENLYGILGETEKNYRSKDFLNRFYITDMSHFAVQGKAKAIFNIKEWKKIRIKTAERFLQKEIELIRPKYIISQGIDVAKFIEDTLEKSGKRIAKKSTNEFETEFPKRYVNSPVFKKFNLNGNIIVHLRLPHLASGMTNDFWIPTKKEKRENRLNGLRKELLEFVNN